MARTRTFAPLDIYLNGRHVGQLERSAAGAIGFQYAGTWLAWDHALPVSLSLPLREQRHSGRAVTAVFENLHPDNRALGVSPIIAAELLPEIETVMVRKLNEHIASDDRVGFRS